MRTDQELRDFWKGEGLSVRTSGGLAFHKADSIAAAARIGRFEFLRTPNIGRLSWDELEKFLIAKGAWKVSAEQDGSVRAELERLHREAASLDQRLDFTLKQIARLNGV